MMYEFELNAISDSIQTDYAYLFILEHRLCWTGNNINYYL